MHPSFLYDSDAAMLSNQSMIDYSNHNSFSNIDTIDCYLESFTKEDNLMCDTFQANQATLDLFSPDSGEAEMDRMDIYNKFFTVARRDRLDNVTFTPNFDPGPRILDLGCAPCLSAVPAGGWLAQQERVPIMGFPPIFEDVVIPSETTPINAFDMHSPMAPVKSSQFDIPHDSSLLEFDFNFAMHEVSDTTNMAIQTCHQDFEFSSEIRIQPRPLKECPFASCTKKFLLQRNLTRHEKTHRKDARVSDTISMASQTSSGEIQTQPRPQKECRFAGCTKKFRRQEHVNRHERTHMKDAGGNQCMFCSKTITRLDNFKSHIYLHTLLDDGSGKSRTAYYPSAVEAWQEMDRKNGRKGGVNKHKEGKALEARVIG